MYLGGMFTQLIKYLSARAQVNNDNFIINNNLKRVYAHRRFEYSKVFVRRFEGKGLSFDSALVISQIQVHK